MVAPTTARRKRQTIRQDWRINVGLPPEMYAVLAAEAQDGYCTVSAVVRRALAAYIKGKGEPAERAAS